MKIATIVGTRPEIIRLSRVIPKLDEVCQHTLIHTGQHYDNELSGVFFKELNLTEPKVTCNCKAPSLGQQIGNMFIRIEQILTALAPDKVLILGDTNSGLSALIAKRMGIKVYHMEAGNRCYSDLVPEEVNRRVIDHCSDVLMPYTEGSRQHLLAEGIAPQHIYVTGNPIYEVLQYYAEQIGKSTILNHLKLKTGAYFLITAHRYETVSNRERLTNLILACSQVAEEYTVPAIFSTHPNTRKMMKKWDIGSSSINFCKPFGFFDFAKLEQNALCVITDSGTAQEECSILGVPSITVRDVTERPETIEAGSNILAGVMPTGIECAIKVALMDKQKWVPPMGYLDKNVSSKVVKILMGAQCGW